MTSHNARTTEFVFESDEYFVAYTDTCGIRFGYKPIHSIDFPADHPMFSKVASLTEDAAEEFHDGLIAAGLLHI